MILRFITILILTGSALTSRSQHPIRSISTPFSSYQINPDSCARIKHTSGSEIYIEANAVATTSDKAKILYREIRRPSEMILNDIRMHTRIGGDQFQLESAGMFEIYAVADGDTLTVNRGKRIQVRMASSDLPQLTGLEGYRYQDSSWQSMGNRIERDQLVEDEDLWGTPDLTQFEESFEGDFGGGFQGGFGSVQDMSVQDSVREEVFQNMNISGFGLFNYDRVIEGEQYVSFQPEFVTTTGSSIQEIVYVVYDDINSVYYFPPYTWDQSFSLMKGRSYQLFSIQENGEVLKLESYPDRSSVEGKKKQLILENTNQIPTTADAFVNVTEIR